MLDKSPNKDISIDTSKNSDHSIEHALCISTINKITETGIDTIYSEISNMVEFYKSKIIAKIREKETIDNIKDTIIRAARNGDKQCTYTIMGVDRGDYFLQKFYKLCSCLSDSENEIFNIRQNYPDGGVVLAFKKLLPQYLKPESFIKKETEFFTYSVSRRIPTFHVLTLSTLMFNNGFSWLYDAFKTFLPGFRIHPSMYNEAPNIEVLIIWY